jgi:small subunit ribosomal protein S17
LNPYSMFLNMRYRLDIIDISILFIYYSIYSTRTVQYSTGTVRLYRYHPGNLRKRNLEPAARDGMSWPRLISGRVMRTSMAKTAVVRCERLKHVRTTGRNVTRHKNFLVHDAQELCRVGDLIKFEECDRVSKRKHHVLKEILWSPHSEAGQHAEEAEAGAAIEA